MQDWRKSEKPVSTPRRSEVTVVTADLAGSTPETAAAITYEIIARPVSLPTDFVRACGPSG